MDVSASKMAKLLNQSNGLLLNHSFLQVFRRSFNAALRKSLATQIIASDVAENS